MACPSLETKDVGPIDRRMNHYGQSRDMVKHARREARVRTVRLRPSLVVRERSGGAD